MTLKNYVCYNALALWLFATCVPLWFNTPMTEITLLYTANMRGDIALLPRLYTFIKRLRMIDSRMSALIDLGDVCAPDVWHCEATGGRSMLVAMDAMGYTALNAEQLSAENRAKLDGQVMSALIDAEHTHVQGDMLFALEPTEGDGHLCIVMRPDASNTLQAGSFKTPGRTLHIAGIRAGQVGIVRLSVNSGETPLLRAFEMRQMPPDTPPDPTITGVVDFVLNEARYYQRKRSG